MSARPARTCCGRVGGAAAGSSAWPARRAPTRLAGGGLGGGQVVEGRGDRLERAPRCRPTEVRCARRRRVSDLRAGRPPRRGRRRRPGRSCSAAVASDTARSRASRSAPSRPASRVPARVRSDSISASSDAQLRLGSREPVLGLGDVVGQHRVGHRCGRGVLEAAADRARVAVGERRGRARRPCRRAGAGAGRAARCGGRGRAARRSACRGARASARARSCSAASSTVTRARAAASSSSSSGTRLGPGGPRLDLGGEPLALGLGLRELRRRRARRRAASCVGAVVELGVPAGPQPPASSASRARRRRCRRGRAAGPAPPPRRRRPRWRGCRWAARRGLRSTGGGRRPRRRSPGRGR